MCPLNTGPLGALAQPGTLRASDLAFYGGRCPDLGESRTGPR